MEYFNQERRSSYGDSSNQPAPVDRTLGCFDQGTFVTAILDERAYEMILECKRRFELLRIGLASKYVLEHTEKVLNEMMLLRGIRKRKSAIKFCFPFFEYFPRN